MKPKKLVFKVSGMHCTACASRLEKSMNKMEGVQECSVNFATESAIVSFDEDMITQEHIAHTANDTGFQLSLDNQLNNNKKDFSELIRLLIAWALTIIIAIPMFLPAGHSVMMGLPMTITRILISGIIMFVFGANIFKNSWASIKSLSLGMDVLIAIGALSAWISALLPFFGISINDYSMTAAMLISVNLTGSYLETIARGKASQAVAALSKFQANKAHKLLPSGETIDVDSIDLVVGDHIIIKNGEKIPTDGKIIKGRTTTDESFLTGESLPVEKNVGDGVYGASINIDGVITVEVEKDAQNNLLAQTIKLVQEAQGTKVPIQILADKITTIFVPIILIISFLSFAIWIAFPNAIPLLLLSFDIIFEPSTRLSDALSASIATLVIACPCALGLATPMALVNGSALGAKKGILIRRGAAIQTLNDIHVVALDKTGTLTEGKPKVTSIIPINIDKNAALEILASLEKLSNHPLATALVQYADTHNIYPTELDDVTNTPGQGVHGLLGDCEWFAGSLKATQELGVTIPDPIMLQIEEELNKGQTLVCLSDFSRKEIKAIVTFADKIKSDAIESLQTLKNIGKRIIMITGDNKNAANTVGKELGISSIIAECTPQNKLDQVNLLKEQGFNVCFVGDGVNDAAALESSNVGVAMGTGTDIANEAGDVILVSGSISSLVSMFRLSKYTFNKIKQNLFWAFFYNIIAIPLAFSGLLHPIFAEVAMTFSSLTVIGNSILLSRKKI